MAFDTRTAILQLLRSFPDPPKDPPQRSKFLQVVATRKGSSATDARGSSSSPDSPSGRWAEPAKSSPVPPLKVGTMSASPTQKSITSNRLPAPTSARADAPATPSSFPMDLLLKAVRGDIKPQEQSQLYAAMIELPKQNVSGVLERAYRDVEFGTLGIKESARGTGSSPGETPGSSPDTQKKNTASPLNFAKTALNKLNSGSSSEASAVSLNKHLLEFGSDLKLGREYTLTLDVTGTAGKPKFTFRPFAQTNTHTITISPMTAQLKKKQVQSVTLTLVMRTTFKLGQVLAIDVDDGAHYFLVVRATSEKSLFGLELTEVEMSEDGGLRVPSLLLLLKNYLYERQGFNMEGLFRLSPKEEELNEVKDQLNRGTFTQCRDVHCISTLIKQWFREMPRGLLNEIPSNFFAQLSSDPEDSEISQGLDSLREPYKSLLSWLIDLLADVAALETVNRMSARNLAIVIAPNLFQTDDKNPLESVLISQKSVVFVHKLILMRLRHRYG